MDKMHPDNFKDLLGKATSLLKENGLLDEDLHLTSLSIQENILKCLKTIDVSEVRKDPVTGQNIVVIVKKCIKWSRDLL